MDATTPSPTAALADRLLADHPGHPRWLALVVAEDMLATVDVEQPDEERSDARLDFADELAPKRRLRNPEKMLAALYPGRTVLGLLPLCTPRGSGCDTAGHGRRCRNPGKRPIGLDWATKAAQRWDSGDADAWRDRIADHVARGGNIGWSPPAGYLVLDADSRTARDYLEARLPTAPTQDTRQGGHYLVRLPDGVEINAQTGVTIAEGVDVDLRPGGKAQIAVEPSRHYLAALGERLYRWRRPLPADLAEVPEIPADLLEAIQARASGKRRAEPAPEAEPEPLERIQAALAALPVTDFRSYADWLRVGMAVHAASGGDPDALAAWADWSAGDPRYASEAAAACAAKWDTFRADGGVGAGTLFALARGYSGAVPATPPEADFAEELLEPEAPAGAPPESPRLRTVSLAGVRVRDVNYLFEPYLPLGMLALNDGDPGAGKTAVAFDLVARITTGEPMPLDTRTRRPGRVLLVNLEDPLEEVVVPRLLAAGADISRIEAVPDTWSAEAVEALEGTIRRMGDVDLIYVDAIMSAVGEKKDAGRDNVVRALLDPLSALAQRCGVTVWSGRHLAKADYQKAIYAGLSSIGFTARARSVLLIGPNPDAPKAERLFAHAKTNVGPIGRSLRFEIATRPVPGVSRPQPYVEWLGTSDRTADDVVRWKPEEENRGADRLAAGAFLRRFFADRESAPASEVTAAAKAEGLDYDAKTWQRARQDHGITSSGGGRTCTWRRNDRLAAPLLEPDDPMRIA